MMKRSVINPIRMLKSPWILAPIAAAMLSACGGDDASSSSTFNSNVDDCNGMNSREETTACEAAYYKALAKAKEELPRFTSREECERLYGACEAPVSTQPAQPVTTGGSTQVVVAPPNHDSVLVPLMAGYIAAQMVGDLGSGYRSRSSYYQELDRYNQERARSNEMKDIKRQLAERDRRLKSLERRQRERDESSSSYYAGSSSRSSAQKSPQIAPTPKPRGGAATSSGGFGNSATANSGSWGSSSSGG